MHVRSTGLHDLWLFLLWDKTIVLLPGYHTLAEVVQAFRPSGRSTDFARRTNSLVLLEKVAHYERTRSHFFSPNTQ